MAGENHTLVEMVSYDGLDTNSEWTFKATLYNMARENYVSLLA